MMRLAGLGMYSRPAPVPKMPTGLIELMEGLTKDVLKNNPQDIYEYCANHMQTLLEIRDGSSHKKVLSLEQKIKKAQEKVKQRADLRWKKYQIECQEKAELANLKISEKEIHSAETLSADTETIKVLKPVHHEYGEIEIYCESTAIDTASNENSGKTLSVVKASETSTNPVISQGVYSITSDETQAMKQNDIENKVQQKFKDTSKNNETISLVETENLSVSLSEEFVKDKSQKMNNFGMRDTEIDDMKSSSTCNLKPLQIKLDDPEEISHGHTNGINSNDLIKDVKEVLNILAVNDFKEDVVDGLNDINSNDVIKDLKEELSTLVVKDLKNDVVDALNNINPNDIIKDVKEDLNILNVKDSKEDIIDVININETLLINDYHYKETTIIVPDTLDTQLHRNDEKTNNEIEKVNEDLNLQDNVQNVIVNYKPEDKSDDIFDTKESMENDANVLNLIASQPVIEGEHFTDTNSHESVNNELPFNETKDDFDDLNIETIKNSDNIENNHMNTEAVLVVDDSKMDEIESIPITNDNIIIEMGSETVRSHTDDNKIEEKYTVTQKEISNIILSDGKEVTNKLLENKEIEVDIINSLTVVIEDNFDDNKGNVSNDTKSLESDSNLEDSICQDYSINIKTDSTTADTIASNAIIQIYKRDDVENKETPFKASDSSNNLQLDSNNKTFSFNDETDVSEDSTNILSQTTDTVKTETIINKENIEEENRKKRDVVDEINEKCLNADQAMFNDLRSSVDESITEETNITIEGVITDNSDEIVLNDSANTMNLETAAVTIQKVFRTFLFKSRGSTFDDSTNDDKNLSYEDNDEDKKESESFLSSTINKDRRTLGINRMDTVTVLQTVNEEKSLSLSTDDSSTLSSAATVIQAHVRGFLVRNKLNSGKTASSNNSLMNSDGPTSISLDGEADQNKNKTILNIHIVPEANNFLSRDESMITSMDLSLDSTPPSSINLHPSYDKTNERRKQLKREDAIQSISPPSNNSGKLSDDVESVKELPVKEEVKEPAFLEQDIAAMLLKHSSQVIEIGSVETSPNSVAVEAVVEEHKSNSEMLSSPEPTETSNIKKRSITKQSSDEMDVVTPFKENSTLKDTENTTKLLNSGEFHETVLPTKVSRSDTSVVSGE